MPEPTHLEARFTFERSTKNTKVFSEQGSQPAIGTLYVQKDALERLGNPTELRVILQSADT